jgi:hypothetical protein
MDAPLLANVTSPSPKRKCEDDTAPDPRCNSTVTSVAYPHELDFDEPSSPVAPLVISPSNALRRAVALPSIPRTDGTDP